MRALVVTLVSRIPTYPQVCLLLLFQFRRLTVLFVFTASSLLAQNGRELWTQTQPREGVVSRQAAWVEAEGASYALDETGMAALLQSAPMEFSRDATQNPFHMQLPLPDGSFAEFAIVEAPVMHPGLAAHPQRRPNPNPHLHGQRHTRLHLR